MAPLPQESPVLYSAQAILALCVRNSTFPQSYYVLQLLTMSHDCLVPVDKHNSVRDFNSNPLNSYTGSKVKYFKEYDKEMPHSHTTDQPMAPQGRVK